MRKESAENMTLGKCTVHFSSRHKQYKWKHKIFYVYAFSVSNTKLLSSADCYKHRRRKLLGRAGRWSPTFWPLWAKKAHRGGNGEEMPAQFSDASAAYGYKHSLIKNIRCSQWCISDVKRERARAASVINFSLSLKVFVYFQRGQSPLPKYTTSGSLVISTN